MIKTPYWIYLWFLEDQPKNLGLMTMGQVLRVTQDDIL